MPFRILFEILLSHFVLYLIDDKMGEPWVWPPAGMTVFSAPHNLARGVVNLKECNVVGFITVSG